MRIQIMNRSVKPSVAIATVLFLAACGGGGGALLATSGIFGATVQSALGRGANDAPLPSADIARLSTEQPVSFTANPVDL